MKLDSVLYNEKLKPSTVNVLDYRTAATFFRKKHSSYVVDALKNQHILKCHSHLFHSVIKPTATDLYLKKDYYNDTTTGE